MRVVLDTNVIVSAFLSPAGNCAVILQQALREDTDVELCFNTAILAEYEEVLCRSKFAGRIHQGALARFFDILHKIGRNVNVMPSQIPLPDETDRKFYDVARAEDAYLVTGNAKHYPIELFIVEPAELVSQLS